MEISSIIPNSLLIQSSVYYSDCNTKRTQTAYTTQGLTPGRQNQYGSYNRFLSMKNLYLVTNTSNKTVALGVDVKNTKATVLSNNKFTLKPYETKKLDLNNNSIFKTSTDSYGTAALQVPNIKSIAVQSIRTRPVGLIMAKQPFFCKFVNLHQVNV